jgi:arabinan endo-1,5-alpha-L-arabinosidase
VTALVRTLVVLSLILLPAPAPAGAAAVSAAGYTNPVTSGVVDTFPDPAMIRGRDGRFYAYGTTNPIRSSAGETGEHILPVISSADMVHWTYVDDVYGVDAHPAWWPAGTRPWAPDIRLVDGSYHLTYSLSVGGVALATGPSPTGPWTDQGLIVPAGNSGCPTGSIDQAMFTDTDGTHYLYWGSYDTLCVSRMTADATALTGPVTQVGRSRRMEGSYVVHRGGFYYLFYSDGGCCDGAFSGYTVKVGRATSPLGPFTTPSGVDLMALTSKDGIVLAANGNGWVGPGHNAIQTDLAGQDWLVYHAIPQNDPDFPPVQGAGGGTLRLTKRPLMIDRLDWIGGWPVVRAGAGPSDGTQAAPVTSWTVGSTFDSLAGWSGTWPLHTDHLAWTGTGASASLSTATVAGDVRVEGDLRSTGTASAGLVVSYVDDRNRTVVRIDRGRQQLVVTVTVRGRTTERAAALPAGFRYDTWHTVVAERRGATLTAEVSADRLRDAVAEVAATVPATAGRIGAASTGGPVFADNIGAAPLATPVTQRVAEPRPGTPLPAYSTEFDGSGRPETTDPAWRWVRGEGATAALAGGALVWPTQAAELNTGTNTAPVLLRDVPPGDFIAETELHFDGVRGNQQAGILLYENDDRYLKLAHSVLPLNNGNGAVLQQTEFGKEAERPTTTPPTAVFAGPMFGGPAAPTMWLRLKYHHDVANNEHDVRMASSTDGVTWTWGGTWQLPRRGALQLGLVSMNATGATATFDYVRVSGVA